MSKIAEFVGVELDGAQHTEVTRRCGIDHMKTVAHKFDYRPLNYKLYKSQNFFQIWRHKSGFEMCFLRAPSTFRGWVQTCLKSRSRFDIKTSSPLFIPVTATDRY